MYLNGYRQWHATGFQSQVWSDNLCNYSAIIISARAFTLIFRIGKRFVDVFYNMGPYVAFKHSEAKWTTGVVEDLI